MRFDTMSKRHKPTKFVKEHMIMEEDERAHPLEDRPCTGDCWECPNFLRIDVCGYEVATNLYFWKVRKIMTKEQILVQLKKDLEARGRSPFTVEDYVRHVRFFQDYYDKPADQMREKEIMDYQHYLITEKGLSASSALRRVVD